MVRVLLQHIVYGAMARVCGAHLFETELGWCVWGDGWLSRFYGTGQTPRAAWHDFRSRFKEGV